MPTIYRSLLGTYQSAKNATNTLPGVFHQYLNSCDPDVSLVVDGVSTRTRPSDCAPWLGPVINLYQAVTGYEMKKIILNVWQRLRVRVEASNHRDEVETNHVVLLGCSRGGFACQVLVHILATYGLPPTNQEKTEEIMKKIASGNHENIDQQPTNLNISLYALDPVGTYGLTGRNPISFFGFDIKKLPAGSPNSNIVIRGRVILMYDETRDLFWPNIYAANSDQDHQLQKIWFQGFHADAWGPSQLAIAVAAYIFADLEQEQNIRFNGNKLQSIITKPWPDYAQNKKVKNQLWNLTKNSSQWQEHQPLVMEWCHHTLTDNLPRSELIADQS